MVARIGMNSLLRSLPKPRSALNRSSPFLNTLPSQTCWLSNETKAAIDKAVASAPVVLFMKGNPETHSVDSQGQAYRFLDCRGWIPGSSLRSMFWRMQSCGKLHLMIINKIPGSMFKY
ncbi:monothiol glutaredoxin-5 [Histoplasma capsulatum var. duboisii H88]|uniref:Monothiol glutaredoxin-5 n=2 Tax=Ajellomyces capsulatus TaxID=5037 RepID=F0U9R9_AJEC8|nr:monothiol glutaredoxin-5 [Histoplasma capsulatum H143]EGC41958.1 monothiol glutaredoxin-5 [Histoplasma capsulatum var. duboisii H88]